MERLSASSVSRDIEAVEAGCYDNYKSRAVKLGEDIRDGIPCYRGLHSKLQAVYEKARGLQGRIGDAERGLEQRDQKIKTMGAVKAFFFKISSHKEMSKTRAQLSVDKKEKQALFVQATGLKKTMGAQLEFLHEKERQIFDLYKNDSSTLEKNGYFVDSQLEIHDFAFDCVFAREIAAK